MTTIAKPRPPAKAGSATSSSPTSSAPATPTSSDSSPTPWGSVAKANDRKGMSCAVFGPPGAGKSTLIATATESEYGDPLLIVNCDGDLKSLADREDLMCWPKDGSRPKSWSQLSGFSSQLARRQAAGSLPFKTITFDTVNAVYDLAYAHVVSTSNARDGRQIFGEANELVLSLVKQWSVLARETGINVFFVAHSEEKQEGENGPIYLRMAVTPGVVKGMYQAVSNIGCLLELRQGKRRLYLHNTTKIIAKVHQPRTGPQLPNEIDDPNMGKIIDHVKGARPYPTTTKKAGE